MSLSSESHANDTEKKIQIVKNDEINKRNGDLKYRSLHTANLRKRRYTKFYRTSIT